MIWGPCFPKKNFKFQFVWPQFSTFTQRRGWCFWIMLWLLLCITEVGFIDGTVNCAHAVISVMTESCLFFNAVLSEGLNTTNPVIFGLVSCAQRFLQIFWIFWWCYDIYCRWRDIQSRHDFTLRTVILKLLDKLYTVFLPIGEPLSVSKMFFFVSVNLIKMMLTP